MPASDWAAFSPDAAISQGWQTRRHESRNLHAWSSPAEPVLGSAWYVFVLVLDSGEAHAVVLTWSISQVHVANAEVILHILPHARIVACRAGIRAWTGQPQPRIEPRVLLASDTLETQEELTPLSGTRASSALFDVWFCALRPSIINYSKGVKQRSAPEDTSWKGLAHVRSRNTAPLKTQEFRLLLDRHC